MTDDDLRNFCEDSGEYFEDDCPTPATVVALLDRIAKLRVALMGPVVHQGHYQRPDFLSPDECPNCSAIAADDAAQE